MLNADLVRPLLAQAGERTVALWTRTTVGSTGLFPVVDLVGAEWVATVATLLESKVAATVPAWPK